jgi:acetyl esterase/lipase
MPPILSHCRNRARILALTTIILAASASTAHAQPSDSSRLASFLVLTRKQLQHPLRSARVERTTTTIGKRADGSPFLVDITRPVSSARTPLPVVILVHGGLSDDAPVRPRSWQAYKDWGTALAASGVAAVMFDHSLGGPQRRLDLSLSEIDMVLRWVAADGARLGFKSDSVHVVGFSAAGLLAPELLRNERPVPVSRMVLFYPLTGIVRPTGAPLHDDALVARMDLGGTMQRLSKRRTPLLLIRAGSDMQPGLLELLDRNVSALLAADARVEVMNVPGEPHGFDLEHDTPTVRAAIERALLFVSKAP